MQFPPLTSFDKEGTRVRKSAEKVGKGIAGVGTAMTAAVTVPLAGLATASAAKFGEVDKSLKLVQQTMGSTDEQAKVLEGAIKKPPQILFMECRTPRMRH